MKVDYDTALQKHVEALDELIAGLKQRGDLKFDVFLLQRALELEAARLRLIDRLSDFIAGRESVVTPGDIIDFLLRKKVVVLEKFTKVDCDSGLPRVSYPYETGKENVGV